MNETWMPINGYEGLYDVSDLGRVKSLDRFSIYLRKGRNIKTAISGSKYLNVRLSKCSIVKNFQVHRLVALTFIPNPENKPCVNHKDGDRLNNAKSNLEWNTSKENHHHMLYVLKRKIGKARFGLDNPASRAVICIETNEIFISARDASHKLNVSSAKICAVCKGNRKRTGGLSFKYA